MVRAEKKYTEALRRICERTDYAFFIKAFRGIGSFFDPWYDYASMERCIAHMENPCEATLRLLQMGAGAKEAELAAEIDRADIESMIEAGIWRREGETIESNNFVVISYQGLFLLTETNPWFESCTHKNTDVYIGSDSFRLAENIGYHRAETALDLCSGTGIQGLLCARFAKKVVSVELNPKAAPVTRFNILLNGYEDVIELREGDLYEVLKDGETFDCIYANPPFIPMADDVVYPICGTGGENGLRVLRRIVDGLPKYLNPQGEAIIFCECLGDEKGVFFDRHVEELGRRMGWQISQVMPNRLESGLQLERLGKLSALFDESFDEEAFHTHMTAVYESLGAKYLYNLLYRIRAAGDGDGVIRHIRQYNPWDMDDTAQVDDRIVIGENSLSQGVFRGKEQLGAINFESVDILDALREGKTVREAAEALWGKYSDKQKYQREGYPAFLNTVLTTCLQLEHIGVIGRKTDSGKE